MLVPRPGARGLVQNAEALTPGGLVECCHREIQHSTVTCADLIMMQVRVI